MTADLEKHLAALDQVTLTPLVRRSLEDDSAEVINWRYRPVMGGFGHAYGVYRFWGQAQLGRERRGWSLILKVCGPERGSQEPTAWDYWQREALVYQSGLLQELPGDLVAPRCLGVVGQPGGAVWLWLEEVIETGPEIWPLERYGLAARHLGRFNGASLAGLGQLPDFRSLLPDSLELNENFGSLSPKIGHALPNLPWLASGRLPELLLLAEAGIAELPRLSRQPLFAGFLPGDSLARCLRLWAKRHRIAALLERLPRTLCHHDAFRRNLLARSGPDGRAQTVAIDWAELGTGVIGEELVALFSGTLKFVAIDIDRIAELDGRIFTGYIAGLRAAGWQGEPRLARFGYTATAALGGIADIGRNWPQVASRVAALPPGAEPPRFLSPGGLAQAAATNQQLISLGEEAADLGDALEGEGLL